MESEPGAIGHSTEGEFFPEPELNQGPELLDPNAGSQSFDPGVWQRGSEPLVGADYPLPMAEGTAVYGYETAGCSTCSQPIYESVVVPAAEAAKANHTISLTGLVFQRDYEDNRRLASNGAGDQLFTNDADEQVIHGYAVSLLRRSKRGIVSELSYWSLNPGPVSAEIAGSPVTTAIVGLDQVSHAPTTESVLDLFSYSEIQRVTRDTNINNIEFNLFRSGGTYFTPKGRQAGYQIVGGFRWFDFEEELLYESFTDTATYPTVPAGFLYQLRARNTLLGLQGGFQHELHIGAKLRIFNLVYGGLYSNQISTIQRITDSNGVLPTVGGDDFNFENSKNDLAFLGQLDLGILYQLSCRTRIRFGYRALGVSGVALAVEQLPYQYDTREFLRVQSNGNLLLDGGYYGIEFAF